MRSKILEQCLKRNKIIKLHQAESLVKKELRLASSDLRYAHESFLQHNYKWTTIQAYYAMFHTARALLYKKGYREKSHFCLIEAIREWYVAEGILSVGFIEAIQLGKSLRENADYHGDFDRVSSKEMLNTAAKFIKVVRDILK